MPKAIVMQPFKWAHHGYQVEEFVPSDRPRDISDECATVAVEQGWVRLIEAGLPGGDDSQASSRPEDSKAHGAAPENRDAAPRRRTKSQQV